MTDQQPEEINNNEDQQKRREKLQLIYSIIQEALNNIGIKDISTYNGEPLTQRWHLFSSKIGDETVLRMYVQGIFGTINADVSLFDAALRAIGETEGVLNRPDATELFDFSEEERPELLRENARMIVERFVRHIPIIFFQLISTALRDSIEAHVNNHVKILLKDHWQTLSKPPNFTLTPSDEFIDHVKRIDKEFTALRKGILGDKKAWLTDERREQLPEEHEQLKAAYQEAKDFYTQLHKAFISGKRNRTVDEWNTEWMTTSVRMFPNLYYSCLSKINDYQPYELAHMQLAEMFDYKPQYMAKLISKYSRLRRKKNKSRPKKIE
jgi:hypothetical protein